MTPEEFDKYIEEYKDPKNWSLSWDGETLTMKSTMPPLRFSFEATPANPEDTGVLRFDKQLQPKI